MHAFHHNHLQLNIFNNGAFQPVISYDFIRFLNYSRRIYFFVSNDSSFPSLRNSGQLDQKLQLHGCRWKRRRSTFQQGFDKERLLQCKRQRHFE